MWNYITRNRPHYGANLKRTRRRPEEEQSFLYPDVTLGTQGAASSGYERRLAALLGGQADANQEAGMIRRLRQHYGTIVLFHHGLHDREPKPTASRHIVAG